MKHLSIGISDFKEIIEDGYYYIDKTLLIKELVDKKSKVTLLPRPRRFGKTLNLSMLNYFFSNTEQAGQLFTNTAIAQHPDCMAWQGQYPVIFITFKDVKVSNWQDAYEKIREIIKTEFDRLGNTLANIMTDAEKSDYEAIIKRTASKTVYEQSLQVLSALLYRHYHKKVIILLDEYDAPIHAAYSYSYYKEMVEFIRNLFSAALKDNNALEFGVLTGILRTAKEGIFSGLNNLNVCTLLEQDFSDKFGFTQHEVDTLLTDYNMQNQCTDIKQWYNGYQFANTIIYNPWSLLMFIHKRGNLALYWVNTSDNALVKMLITRSDETVKTELESLLQEKTIKKTIDESFVFPSMERSEIAIWSLLVFSGYLTPRKQKLAEGQWLCELAIPNQEVFILYKNLIRSSFQEVLTDTNIKALREALAHGNGKLFEKILQEYLLNSTSMFDLPSKEPEKSYHLFVLGLLVTLQDLYEVDSNRESGYGRYDIMLIPKDITKRSIIIEFKRIFDDEDLGTAATQALEQIHDKQYAQNLKKRGIQTITAFGIAFKGKEVLLKQEEINTKISSL
jgi:predicted AAA-ATPase/PD-(D/E)XK nuclease superfamily protein